VGDGAWHLRKAKSLVKLLVLAPGHALHREQIMDLLWPELGKRAATNNLRGSLHAARTALASDPVVASRYLASKEERIALCPEVELWVDVEAFEEAASAARRSREPTAYRAAIELYGGELLPEDRYEEWAEEHRRRLRETYLSLLLGVAGLHEERGEYEPVIEALGRVISEEPARQEAHVSLMRLYALSGNKGEALAQYVQLEEVLARELDTEPAASSRALREEIAAGRFPPQEAPSFGSPPEKPPGDGRHNLPAPRTSFVGREREIVELKRELAMTRLLTLTGVGGSGKTRLALEVARDLVGAYPDGVWLVELAPLSESGLVSQAVAGALGVHEQQGRPVADVLVDTLRSKEMLLVLDNCEHLVEAVARLVDTLLDSCLRLRVLATSRELLNVAGEMNRPVLPLSVPASQREPAVAELEGSEAVRLFLERARQRNPSLALTPENAQAVAEVCRELAGMPLAIELAAARVGALSVEEITQRLKGSIKLLSGGGRTASERHQSLRGALDWSYDLLAEREQMLFRRLSVFGGGWALGAAEAVGTGDGIEEEVVLDLLSRLVDKSLVVAEANREGRVRYRMLEPVRQYAREKLEEGDGGDAVRRRHATFFLALAEEADPAVEGAQQQEWLERLEAEHDNLRAALQWSLEQGEDAELALRTGAALGDFWYLRGYFSEGRRWLEEALTKSDPAPRAVRARALERVSQLALFQGDLDRAESASEEGIELKGVELFRTGGGDSVAAELKRMLGMVMANRGESQQAIELLEQSLAHSQEADSVRGMAISLFCLGSVRKAQGDFDRAVELLEEALTMLRESGDPALIASILAHLGMTFVFQGDLERATVVSEVAVAMLRKQKHRSFLADALDNLGWAALLRGDPEQARTLYAESLGLRQEVGDKLSTPETLEGLACEAGARGEVERAAKLLGAAQMLNEVIGHQQEAGARALQEPYLDAARSRLSEAEWGVAFTEGRNMGLEEAVEYALSEEGPATPLTTVPEQSSAEEPPPTLTRREREVANLLERRFTSRQIASELHLSERTVEKHVANILRKLNLHSREQVAVQMAERRSYPS
jgi:predicted ATPase/DNA-binding SARP family transcriptional activator/DNA-binding CsgD family transcriptional regulator